MVAKWMLLGLAVVPTAAWTQQSGWNWDNADAKTKAICAHVGEPHPPATDRPTAVQRAQLKGCDSEKLYYGQGVKPDYVKARQCAFTEEDKDDQVFGGKTILMQVYANGLGVERDPDLATAYACQIDGAPAEIDFRVAHLQALKQKPGKFDYCDDITSGLAGGFCQQRDSTKAGIGRDAKLKAVVARLPKAAQGLYPTLKKSFDAFLDAHDDEVDQTGTARAQMVIEEEDVVRDQFLKDLDRLASGQWPAATADAARSSDTLLNASYRKALTAAGSKDNLSTIKVEDIRKAQRSWVVYRDQYVRFAGAVPGTSAPAILDRITRLRAAQLDQLAGLAD